MKPLVPEAPCALCGKPAVAAKIISVQAPLLGPDEPGEWDGYGEFRCETCLPYKDTARWVAPGRPCQDEGRETAG